MPVDHTKEHRERPKRQPRRIVEDEAELSLRRMRGEISCAECRRLKLKCDKQVPCGSCQRRGCSSICPNGSLSSGQGTRFILADTEQLHAKISEMSKRIRELEDALAIAHTSGRHPLLGDEFLKIKFGPELAASPPSSAPVATEDSEVKETANALGTMTITDEGSVQYLGRSAGPEALLLADEGWAQLGDSDSDPEDQEPYLSPEITRLANLFPLTEKDTPLINQFDVLLSYLPPFEEAGRLCDMYTENVTFYFKPFDAAYLQTEVLGAAYREAAERASRHIAGPSSPRISPHRLASLFLIFGLGYLTDPKMTAFHPQARRYYDLARAAMSMKPVLDSAEMDTVEALGFMATFKLLSDTSRPVVWSIFALAGKIAQSIGLDHDSSAWNMDPRLVQRRRTLFWELTTCESLVALAMGRPPAFHTTYIDCELPEDEEATTSENGEPQPGYHWCKYKYTRDLSLPVVESTLAAKEPTYADILALDRKIRQTGFPATFKPYVQPGDPRFHSAAHSLRSFYLSQQRTILMLYIHRNYFAKAMLEYPDNPLRSPFAPSFLVSYRCASIIIKAALHFFQRIPALAERMFFLLNHVFSAAIVVGTVVSRTPSSNMAPTALVEFQHAIDVFERSAVCCRYSRVAWHVLLRIQEKATRAYNESRTGVPSPLSSGDTVSHDSSDELAIFGGQTRMVANKSVSRRKTGSDKSRSRQTSQPRSPGPSGANTQDGQQQHGAAGYTLDIHPVLLEYLGGLPNPADAPPADHSMDDASLFSWSTPPNQEYHYAYGGQLTQNMPPQQISSIAVPASAIPEFMPPGSTQMADQLSASYHLRSAPSLPPLQQQQESAAVSAELLHMNSAAPVPGTDTEWLAIMRDMELFDPRAMYPQNAPPLNTHFRA